MADFDTLNLEILDSPGAPRERFSHDGLDVSTIVCKVPWATRYADVQNILGGVKQDGTVQLPVSYSVTAYPRVFATGAGIEPWAGRADTTDADDAKPNWARLTVQFETVSWYLVSDVETSPHALNAGLIISEDFEPETEALTLPGRKDLFWLYTPGGDPEYEDPIEDDETPGIIRRGGTWVVTRHFAVRPAGGLSALYTLRGTVNSQNHYSWRDGKLFAPETLLMGSPRITEQWSSFGTVQLRVELPMSINEDGWNKFLRAGHAVPQRMFTSDFTLRPNQEFWPIVDNAWQGWVPVPVTGA